MMRELSRGLSMMQRYRSLAPFVKQTELMCTSALSRHSRRYAYADERCLHRLDLRPRRLAI